LNMDTVDSEQRESSWWNNEITHMIDWLDGWLVR
jgi:hypothetical protein